MRDEFSNRIGAQRAVLRAVNRAEWSKEELFGLSSKAIDRWASRNSIDPAAPIATLVRNVGAKLFFLANKSQEQVSPEYSLACDEIAGLCDSISQEVESFLHR